MRRLLSVPLLLLAAIVLPRCADAQIRRCVADNGTLIYTDRSCADVDAIERPGQANGGRAVSARGRMPGCMRNVRDLLYELTAAIDNRDVNQLAGVYDWAGMSSRGAYRIMAHLAVIADRPLVDANVILPTPQISVQADGSTTVSGSLAADVVAGARVDRTPVAIRIDQTLANGSTPSRTVFGLRRRMGCWWITF